MIAILVFETLYICIKCRLLLPDLCQFLIIERKHNHMILAHGFLLTPCPLHFVVYALSLILVAYTLSRIALSLMLVAYLQGTSI